MQKTGIGLKKGKKIYVDPEGNISYEGTPDQELGVAVSETEIVFSEAVMKRLHPQQIDSHGVAFGKPYIVAWQFQRDPSGFLGLADAIKGFDSKEKALKFYKEAREKFKTEPYSEFKTGPTYYERKEP